VYELFYRARAANGNASGGRVLGGLADHVWSLEELVGSLEPKASEVAA